VCSPLRFGGTQRNQREPCGRNALVERYTLPLPDSFTTIPTRLIFDSLKRNFTPRPAVAGDGTARYGAKVGSSLR
jgi:hypothetical protein